MSATTTYRLHIRANGAWLRLDWKGLWDYRDLLLVMVRRDFIAKYKQTLLGPAWFVVQPLLMTLVFTVVFGKVAKIPTGATPPALFYLCGLLAWNYFSQNFASTSSIFINNAGLFGKVYFPRLVPPLAAILSNLFNVAVQIVIIVVFYAVYKNVHMLRALLGLHADSSIDSVAGLFGARWQIVFLPLLIVQVAVISLGVGMWMSALTVTYRDFTHLSAFLMQLWLYATPVIYPLEQFPPKWTWVSLMNPMSVPVEATRYVILGTGMMSPHYVEFSIFMTVTLFVSGLLVFQRVERTFIDTV